jgi:hypothetical protein
MSYSTFNFHVEQAHRYRQIAEGFRCPRQKSRYLRLCRIHAALAAEILGQPSF